MGARKLLTYYFSLLISINFIDVNVCECIGLFQISMAQIESVSMRKIKSVPLEEINKYATNTLLGHLDIKCVEIGEDYIVATMPVDHRTHQPMGLLHGGASAALIESIGSIGSTLLIDITKEAPVGIEINANHIGGVKSGSVKAIGKIVHAGSRTHLWQVDIFDESNDKLICTGRLTVMIVPIT
ncbi:phenylacetic acid degradation-related protein [Fluviicola taffensis DSM 16823]|uniref:Phenylacetic acid degradation-related protein n=2 Tax=Fluviicola TaxID=332102 RepID=F2ICR1_FLUTR|nr:phenylacetic acid degradation-related protein [Fluviicola taffensis DSM 16823]